MIFDETTLRKLNQLALVASKVRAGVLKGERRSTKRGTSIEFADYRDYTPGDDLRRLDWNVYARLERPFIKLLEEEEDLAVHILVDASKSMDWGENALHKFQYALKLAAALGSVALGAGDYLTVTLLRAAQSPAQYGPARGQQHLMRLLAFLEPQTCDGTTDLNQMLRDYTLAARRPGLTFLISDLFSPAGFETGLNQLLSRGYELTLVHLLAPDELEPPLAGDLRLIDIETDFGQDVSLDAGLRELYRRRLQAWQNEIQLLCGKRGIRYLPVSTAYPWDELVLLDFRKAGIVK
ncbi:MAG TPA: DUF58 domain-containing protein [Anaerolineales bacterium]|nr:DUF58 domain-containing protein [Anaerolineales bacterium]